MCQTHQCPHPWRMAPSCTQWSKLETHPALWLPPSPSPHLINQVLLTRLLKRSSTLSPTHPLHLPFSALSFLFASLPTFILLVIKVTLLSLTLLCHIPASIAISISSAFHRPPRLALPTVRVCLYPLTLSSRCICFCSSKGSNARSHPGLFSAVLSETLPVQFQLRLLTSAWIFLSPGSSLISYVKEGGML